MFYSILCMKPLYFSFRSQGKEGNFLNMEEEQEVLNYFQAGLPVNLVYLPAITFISNIYVLFFESYLSM